VALVAALASDAELLLLDEPTSGLDPLMVEVFRECIDEIRGEERAVLLSSHILSEVEALCERVTIIRAGRTVESASLAEMRHLTRTSIDAVTSRPPAGLERLDGVHNLRVDGDRVRLDVDSTRLDQLVRTLSKLGLRSLTSRPPTLEELFLRHYRDDRAAADGPGARATAAASGDAAESDAREA
jgi:ABC-2 type transport system ATP-binding protein